MRKLEYKLAKEDYQSWIHWNVENGQSKKMKIGAAALYVIFIGVFLWSNIKSAKGDIMAMLPSFFVAAVVGVGIMYMTSKKNQEHILWKRTGLLRMEKNNAFPEIILTLEEKSLSFRAEGSETVQAYSYRDIEQIKETDRLFMLGTSGRVWQLVAKTAFRTPEEMDEFRTFMEDKIRDAHENPDEYPSVSQPAKDEGKSASVKTAGSTRRAEDGDEDEPEITPVDTSHMGKIGKMAHIMAAMAAENEEGSEPAKEEPKAEEEPASEENADASGVQLPEEEKPQKAGEI